MRVVLEREDGVHVTLSRDRLVQAAMAREREGDRQYCVMRFSNDGNATELVLTLETAQVLAGLLANIGVAPDKRNDIDVWRGD